MRRPGTERGTARDTFPVFDVGGDYHDLGQGNGIYFDLYTLNTAPKPAMITIQTPPGYGVSLVHRSQFVLGDAEVDTNRGAYKGEFEVAPRAAFDADPGDGRMRRRHPRSDVVDGAQRARTASSACPSRSTGEGRRLSAHDLPRLAAEAAS